MNKKISKIIDRHSYFFDKNGILVKKNKDYSEKISIGIIVDTAFTIPPKTGVCYRLYYLSKELLKNRIDVKLFLCNRNYTNNDEVENLSKERELEIHLIPEKIFYNHKLLLKILRSSEIDAIQFEDSETAILLGKYSKEQLNIPLILELHDDETTLKRSIGGYKNSEIALTNFVHYISGELADIVIAMTNNDIQNFIKDIGISSAKLVLSPNGIDSKLFRYHGPNNKEKNIIFIGNFFYPPNKRAAEIIIRKILPKLRSYNFRATFIGMAPKELINKYGDQNINFTGFINNINQEFKKATIALCPITAGSGMKVKILNFAAAGLPIISTTIGARGYENLKGIILENDIDKYDKIIQKIIKNPNWAKAIGQQNRKEVVKYFSWSRIAKNVANIYRICVANYKNTIFSNTEVFTKAIPSPFWLTEKRVRTNPNPIYYVIRRGKINKRKL